MKKAILTGLSILAAVSFCDKDTAISPETKVYQAGKNRFTTTVDGDTREYYVHVPAAYTGSAATPAVIMLHGTGEDGANCYEVSGWPEVGETETILTVFPSSWRYNVIDEGVTLNTTKWHSFPGGFEFCAGESPRDDIRFLRQVISELKGRFNVDDKRIYLAGFSNGGQMAFRCAVEMSDVFAAVVEASGSSATDTTAIPRRDLPVTFQIGNGDDKLLGNSTDVVPLSSFEWGLNNSPWFQRIVHSHTSTFHFSTRYTISGDTNTIILAAYPGLPAGGNRNFNVLLIKGLEHRYPNGINHWMKGAERHWAWMKQYALP
jgi:polyhydroxybutyrate depolymerase